jgi:putative phage-type endonuclease
VNAFEEVLEIPADPLSPAWHEARRHFIGASDAPAILGLSPWRNSLDVWAEKHGMTQPDAPTIATSLGHELEDFIARKWYAEHDPDDYVGLVRIMNMRTTIRHANGWLAASPDRMVCVDGEPIGGLECKLVGGHMSEHWADGPPIYVVCQAMVQMAVMGWSWIDVCSLHAGFGWDWRCARIHRDDAEIDDLLARLGEWWQRHVVDGERPTPVGGRVAQTMAAMYPPPEGTSVVLLPPDAGELVEEIRRAKALRADLSEDIERNENRLKVMLGDHTDGQLDPDEAPVVTWRSQTKTTYDTKALLAGKGFDTSSFTTAELSTISRAMALVERTSTFRVLRFAK